jgi:hypothetical protein
MKMLALLAISLVPMFYPMSTFVSVKYVIPLLMLLPFAMQSILERGVERASARAQELVSWGIVAAGLLAALVSIEPAKRAPFIRLTATSPRTIATHDGARTFGAFAVALCAAGRDDSGEPGWKAAQAVFDSLQSDTGPDLWIVADDSSFRTGRVSWRFLRTILARRGIHGKLIGPHTLRYDVGARHVVFTVPSDQEAERKKALDPESLRLDLFKSETPEIDIDQRVQAALAKTDPA